MHVKQEHVDSLN